jgi:P4 family phage/plasmid primase-like protien
MAFDTIAYCISQHIPSFTFAMDASKKCNVKWSAITAENFQSHIGTHNGFAIITGEYIVIDFDLKHSPPQAIYNTLEQACSAIERTPGGYHFWFKGQMKCTTDAYWNNQSVKGLDIRGLGGICYTAPSRYMVGNEMKEYRWCKGDLSSVTDIPESISTCLMRTIVVDDVEESDIMIILNGLRQERCDSYSDWIKVGMALKHSGYTCDVWDEWSKKSHKYKIGDCSKRWRSFHSSDRPIGIGTLYHWLKEDNYPLFVRFQSTNDDIRTHLLTATHASIAHAYHSMNPHSYLATDEGWYILQPNNTWIATGSTDMMRIPRLINDIQLDTGEILLNIKKTFNADDERDQMLRKKIGATLKRISHSGFVRGAMNFLSGMYYCKEAEQLFNQKRDLFAFTNGVIQMNTMEFRAIEPNDYITVTCGYPYRDATDEEKEMVLTFLEKIFPNAGVLKYILAALSKTFIGSNVEQVFHVFTGAGANGKSCLMDLCKIVFGEYYQTFSASYLTKENDGKDRPLPELAAARYARMLVTSEPDERDRFQINLIKNITGNEEVSFRGMYAKMATKYIPQYKMWVLTNDVPKLSKYDQAIQRRMRCVHFPTRFVYSPQADNEELRDDSLCERFKVEEGWRYGLLGLLLDAAKDKLDMPDEVRACTDAYMMENNPVGAWLQEWYDITGRRDDMIQKTELFKAFLDDTGAHKTQKGFYEDMVKCNVMERKTEMSRFFIGLKRKIEKP